MFARDAFAGECFRATNFKSIRQASGVGRISNPEERKPASIPESTASLVLAQTFQARPVRR